MNHKNQVSAELLELQNELDGLAQTWGDYLVKFEQAGISDMENSNGNQSLIVVRLETPHLNFLHRMLLRLNDVLEFNTERVAELEQENQQLKEQLNNANHDEEGRE